MGGMTCHYRKEISFPLMFLKNAHFHNFCNDVETNYMETKVLTSMTKF